MKCCFSTVHQYVDEEFKEQMKIFDAILNVEEDTVDDVYQLIDKSEEDIMNTFDFIESTAFIRPKKVRILLQLFTKLAAKYEYIIKRDKFFFQALLTKTGVIDENGYSSEKFRDESVDNLINIFPRGTLGRAVKEDDVNLLKLILSKVNFNSNILLEVDSILLPIKSRNNTQKVSLIQLIALFGSIKCFKFVMSSFKCNLEGVNIFAVAGGNMEIIHALEEKNCNFDNCLEIAVTYHRYEIHDYLLVKYKRSYYELSLAVNTCNIRAFFFLITNDLFSGKYIKQIRSSISSGNYHFMKYMCDRDDTSLIYQPDLQIDAVEKNGTAFFRYITERDYYSVNRINGGWTLLGKSAKYGSVRIAKLIIEEFGGNINQRGSVDLTALELAIERFSLNIIKYLKSKGARTSKEFISNINFNPFPCCTLYLNDFDEIEKILPSLIDKNIDPPFNYPYGNLLWKVDSVREEWKKPKSESICLFPYD